MLWECDCCGNVVESDPHSHSDTGGCITVQGPHCCDQAMDVIPGRLVDGYVVEGDES